MEFYQIRKFITEKETNKDMKTIVITQEQMEVIQEYLDGKIGMFTATDHQMEVMSGVIDEATALLEELDAYDELDENNDTIRWYITKYNEQQGD